jgi:hypothetical protein
VKELALHYATGVNAAKAKVAARVGDDAAERWAQACIARAEHYARRSMQFDDARSAGR